MDHLHMNILDLTTGRCDSMATGPFQLAIQELGLMIPDYIGFYLGKG